MGNYGKRTCLHCRKTFTAMRLFQLFCSEQCRHDRKAEQRRMSKRRCAARIKAEIGGLKARIRELEGECERLSANLQATSDELKAAQTALLEAREELETVRSDQGKPIEETFREAIARRIQTAAAKALSDNALYPKQKGISSAPAVDTSDWEYCERMNVRALRLPCGQRGECEGCERIQPKKDAAGTVMEPGDRKCALCGNVFTPKQPWQKYCSSHCQTAVAKIKATKKGKE